MNGTDTEADTGAATALRSRLRVVGVWLAGVVVLGLLAGWLAGRGSGSERVTVDDPVGRLVAIAPDQRVPAAALSGPLLGGGTFDPVAYAGRIQVVSAWASWCEPCKAELPVLARMAGASYAAPVQFIGLDVEEGSIADGQQMAARYGLTYPSIFDQDKVAYAAIAPPLMSASGVPGTVVVDAQGRLAATIIGPVDENELTKFLGLLAAEKP